MAILPILQADNPLLHRRAKKVRNLDASLQKLIDDMIETMRAVSGVGLAAPQVGVSLRIAIIEIPEQDVLVLVNPEIVKRSGERDVVEGCLSLPGYRGDIQRSLSVTVKAKDRREKEFRIKAKDDLLAQALEHEIDHLNGTLYYEHLDSPEQLYKIEPGEEVGEEQ